MDDQSVRQSRVNQRSWLSKWGLFGALVFEPFFLIPFVVSGVLLYIAFINNDSVVMALTATGASLFLGVAGAVITNHWNEMNGTRAIVARGQTAIRGLEILWNNVSSLDGRVATYLERLAGSDVGSEAIQTYLEEVRERCRLLKTEALSSIDNWRDIIPEADVKSLLQLQADLETGQGRVGQLEQALADQQDASSLQSDQLRQELHRMREELLTTRKELAEKSWLSPGGVINISPYPSTVPIITGTVPIITNFLRDDDDQAPSSQP